MAAYTVTVSPSELLTRYSNSLQVTVQTEQSAAITSLSLKVECRLVIGGKVKETYLVAEKKYAGSDFPDENPVRLQCNVDVSRKGPLTFSCPDFSIQYIAVLEAIEKRGGAFREEKPIIVVPGRITESEMEAEKQRSGAVGKV